jgi:Arc/MetJ-type ribon-helix-helix transcriptional regulator
MKSLNIEVPDRMAADIERLVRDGFFPSEAEFARVALASFIRTHQAELQERFQREDIAWAVAEAKAPNS